MNPDPIAALDAEWEAARVRTVDVVAQWASDYRELADCQTLTDILARIRRYPDFTLRRLIAITQAGGDDAPWASLVIVKSMLGKLILMARTDQSEISEWISQLWLIIHDYPLRRRPQKIAANLSLDTRKAVRSACDSRQISVDAASWDALPRTELPEPSAAAVLTTATQLGLLDAQTQAMLTSVYADGLDGRQAARAHGTTPATVRWRCSRAVRVLAAHREELLAAA